MPSSPSLPCPPRLPRPRGLSARLRAVTLCAALWLAACGGGGSAPEPAPPASAATEVAAGQRAQAAVGAAGGTVLLTTHDGARFTLDVPAGAVPEGTVLVLETAAPAAGRRLHLRLSPAGLVPALPLQLTLALPASMALPSGAALVYDRAPVPYTRLADGSLQLRLAALAGGTAGAAADGGRAQALAARALAGLALPACSGAPVLDTAPDGGLADTAPVEADVYGTCMLGAVNALAVSGQFAEAVRLASAIGAYLQSIGAANTDGLSTRFLTEARTLACTAYGQALDDAAGTTVTSFATLSRAVKPVLFWEAAAQRLGAVCPGIAPAGYVDVVQNLTSDALRYYASRQGTVVDVGSVEYTEALQEARDGEQAVAQVRSLEAPAPVQTLAQAQIRERAQPALVDAVLQAPWQRCRDSNLYDELSRLVSTAGELDRVLKAAQYCGTRLQALSRQSNGDIAETLDRALGGERAGSNLTRGSLFVPRNGRLELSGAIGTLGCPAGRSDGTEALSVRIAGVEVRRLSAPYLGTPVILDMGPALATAGVDAAAFEAPLTIERVGTPCAGFWGDSPAPLLQLDLSFNNDMRVTVFRTIDSCNVLVDPTPPLSDAKFFRSTIMDESSRQSLPVDGRVNCGPRDWTATQQLRRIDARTLRWQQDARWSHTWLDFGPFAKLADGNFSHSMFYNVRFARAGRVTVTYEQTAGSCRNDADSGTGVFAYTLARSGLERGASHCVSLFGAEPTPSISFDVVAGQVQSFISRFEVLASVEADTLIREHASTHTIRFEPAP